MREKAGALDVRQLGQVFTTDQIVRQMLALRRNVDGRVLEPSCGAGAFSAQIPNCVALEIDPRVAHQRAQIIDFFDYAITEQFDTIIGNPPYVRYQDILPATRSRLKSDLFDERSNLYLFFIEKCVQHLKVGGELIFITPRDFIKATAARRLNEWLFEQGSITDFIDLGDARVFDGALPNCAIFRFEKGRQDRTMRDGRIFHMQRGQLLFLNEPYQHAFSDLFFVKVGAVSGADSIFTHPEGNQDFVCSKTAQTGELRRMIYDIKSPLLAPHKETLLARRVRPFTEKNWWHWGRDLYKSDQPRLYVNGRTRNPTPFFTHECTYYDGAVLAIFPRNPSMNIARAVQVLNTVPWQELGFVCGGRFLFTQRSLESCLLPEPFFVQLQEALGIKTEG